MSKTPTELIEDYRQSILNWVAGREKEPIIKAGAALLAAIPPHSGYWQYQEKTLIEQACDTIKELEAKNAALLARMEPLVWTKDRPEKEDWYWARLVYPNGQIVDLGIRMVEPINWQYATADAHYEFAGPIPAPQEPTP